jgi:16S rRNA G1207 methylase RsmC
MIDRERSSDHYFTSHPKSKVKLGLIRTRLRGVPFEFQTASSVFSKRRVDTGTRLLIEAMVLPKTGCVLDVGCGYGAVGIAAATFNPSLQVMMTDVNVRALRLARDNVHRNGVTNAEVTYGYLYEPVEALTFNCVLSNPPVSAGMETVKAIVNEAPKVMDSNATFQVVIRSKVGAKTLPSVLNETFGNCAVLARESGYRVLIGEKR